MLKYFWTTTYISNVANKIKNECTKIVYSVFRLGEIQGNHKGLLLQEMYLTLQCNAIDFQLNNFQKPVTRSSSFFNEK